MCEGALRCDVVVGRVRAKFGYAVLVGDGHQREKCLSCIAPAASGGNQPVADLNHPAFWRANEADAAHYNAMGGGSIVVVADRRSLAMLMGAAKNPADGCEVALEGIALSPVVLSRGC